MHNIECVFQRKGKHLFIWSSLMNRHLSQPPSMVYMSPPCQFHNSVITIVKPHYTIVMLNHLKFGNLSVTYIYHFTHYTVNNWVKSNICLSAQSELLP